MKFKLLFFITAIMTQVYSCSSQTSIIKPENLQQNDTSLMTYYFVGTGCPFCNRDHKEIIYGFKIICVGCNMTNEIERNNLEVTHSLDLKYGQGWTDNFLSHYCEKESLNFIDKTGVKNRNENLKIE